MSISQTVHIGMQKRLYETTTHQQSIRSAFCKRQEETRSHAGPAIFHRRADGSASDSTSIGQSLQPECGHVPKPYITAVRLHTSYFDCAETRQRLFFLKLCILAIKSASLPHPVGTPPAARGTSCTRPCPADDVVHVGDTGTGQ